jgi:hypothetical protein
MAKNPRQINNGYERDPQATVLAKLRADSAKMGISSGRRFDFTVVSAEKVIALLTAAAAASAGIMFGFNRSAGCNVVVYLEGDKEVIKIYDPAQFEVELDRLREFFWDYAADKFPDIRRELTESGIMD